MNHRFLSAARIGSMFAAVWAFVGALYLGRGQVGEWRWLVPMLVIFGAVAIAIVASAPLCAAPDTGSRGSRAWRAAVLIGLFLLTMLGFRWIRGA